MSHTDETAAALYAGILEHPENDLARLVYADRLEEIAAKVQCAACDGYGTKERPQPVPPLKTTEYIDETGRRMQWVALPPHDMKAERRCPKPCDVCGGSGWVGDGLAERAEFIRLQIELANHRASVVCHQPGSRIGYGCNDSNCPRCGPERVMHSRSLELFLLRWNWWYPTGIKVLFLETGFVKVVSLDDNGDCVFVCHKGFVDEVRAPLAWLIGGECERCWGDGRRGDPRYYCYECGSGIPGRTPGHLRELVRQQPITRVTVTDREPWSDGPGSTWFLWVDDMGFNNSTARHYIPAEIYRLMKRHPQRPSVLATSKRFPTREAAMLALSDALLAWAKQPDADRQHGTTGTHSATLLH